MTIRVGDEVSKLKPFITGDGGLEVGLSTKDYSPRCWRFSVVLEDGGFGGTSTEQLLKDLINAPRLSISYRGL